ncbi:hypothetical protein HPS36_02100 [Halorubrum salinarum]|uniref:Uncharacterized protein n=1 Tax=Halorubrum salinarum TaxID=2739057 RepID=A0A7D4BV84_9EURY|nr:hypothetical protein [Halorubrum salinarum]QKG91695.1 hypothetical protein HPS36_02100 [Halorubrum salinarum]
MIGSVLSVGATDLGCYTSGSSPAEADLLSCLIGDAGAAFGTMEMFAMVVAFGLLISLYIASDFEPAAPTLGTILVGSMLIPALPGQFSRIGLVIMLVGVVAGIFAFGQRYILEVGT